MSDDLYGAVLAASPPILAEAAIRRVHELLEAGADSADVHEVVATSVALLNMHQRNRPGRKHAWLAKVTSFAFPRTFSTGPLPKTDDLTVLAEAAWLHHHVCFTAEITHGSKSALGRAIELQLPVDDAERLAQQMLRMVAAARRQANRTSRADQAQGQTSPNKGDQVT